MCANIFELADKLYNIPGILPSENPSKGFHDSGNRFVSGKVAIIALWDLSGWLIDVSKQGKGFNWDIVTFPEWSHRPGIGKGASSHAISISPGQQVHPARREESCSYWTFPHIRCGSFRRRCSSRARGSKMFGFRWRPPPFLCPPVLSFTCRLNAEQLHNAPSSH
ncbi:hypothetical protein PV433_18175 [Paenibacillus sp. GYB004]|uniref:hypothetical protein n=1 Tax=Paenibacillus sp. GYB004 TaxID=2994393 RepID=UPI002F9688ED